MTAAESDRAKAGRILEAIPADASWLTTLSQRLPLHRVSVVLPHGVDNALATLRRDRVRFTAPELAEAHEGLLEALDRLLEEFAGTFAPDINGPPRYTEVPPEWKRADPTRYYEALSDLSRARDAVLERYEELMNVMSQSGHLPAPQDPPAGQSFKVTTGNNSPVQVTAPHAYAAAGGTATAGIPQPPQSAQAAPAPRPWYRSWTSWGTIAGFIGAAAAIYAIFK
ncbi:hypothetical protein J7I97_25005 [Streptomyces sp. ISL-87]|uniref:hypothetical protein n=1 Tax=Streptomyces sp. ISL-87 TaxID=2819188 RepID=UPI001BEAEBBC|nr:hypothetical protein [Streptomyces sp. ISL-87]MBT2611427.1 hypothetical protein [Streptomyces sp. ISL-87]